jgi:hypothetical protein
MIVMMVNRPHWLCDMCRYDLPAVGGVVLYNRPNGTRHYPTPIITCSEACSALAEGLLMAGPIERIPWPAFRAALTEREQHATT